MMKHFLLTACLLAVLCQVTIAQPLRGKAVSGALYLNDGTEIVAPFTYHEKEQIIVQKDTTGMQIYTTFHVDSFFYYDPELMWQRRFHKRMYRDRPHFFETVTPGEVSIVRLKLANSVPDRMVINETDRHRLDYSYFVLHQDSLFRLRDYSLKNLKHIHPELWKEVKRFARNSNLDFYQISDKIQMIRKLNALLDEQDTFSLQ
jgi:hypothetical protein